MQDQESRLQSLIRRAGFSSTYERVRLERLIWFTALEISPHVSPEQWSQIRDILEIPEDVQQRRNFNYLLKTRSDQPETYQD